MTIGSAVRAEIRRLPRPLRTSALAAVAVDLAARLDARPADKVATQLSRELRQVLAELQRHAGSDLGSEVQTYLDRISNPSFRGPGD
jgi:hypothetical protein